MVRTITYIKGVVLVTIPKQCKSKNVASIFMVEKQTKNTEILRTAFNVCTYNKAVM